MNFSEMILLCNSEEKKIKKYEIKKTTCSSVVQYNDANIYIRIYNMDASFRRETQYKVLDKIQTSKHYMVENRIYFSVSFIIILLQHSCSRSHIFSNIIVSALFEYTYITSSPIWLAMHFAFLLFHYAWVHACYGWSNSLRKKSNENLIFK